MEDLDDIRKQYPNLAGYSDRELTQILSDKLGVTKEYAQNSMGIKPNTAGFGTDTAIDLGRGLVGVGRIATGAADLATGGASGRAIKSVFGGDLNDVDKKLASNYSDKRQDAEEEIHNAKGFTDTIKAYMNNPRAAFGEIVQGVPSMLVPIGAAGKVAGAVERRLAQEAVEKGLEGAAAKQFISDGVRASTANKLATPAAWGGVSATQTADQQVSENPDDAAAMYKASLGAGLVSAAGMGLSSKLPGGGAAQSFATGGLMNSLEGNVIPRTAMAVANQAGTNAAINAGTTGAVNLANGRDFTQGMAESAAAGVAPGVAFGLAHGMTHGRQPVKTDGDGNVVVNGQSLSPEVAAQQMAQMQQEQAGRAHQAQAQTDALEQMRQAITDKYGGVKPDTFVKADGTEGHAGFLWGGEKFMTQEALQKAVDLQVKKEAQKTEGQMAGEHVLVDVMQQNGIEPTFKNISTAGDLFKGASKLMEGADTPDVVKVRIDRQLADETKTLNDLSARVTAANERLEMAKKNTQETSGHDEAEVRAQKNLDSLKSKIEQQNSSIKLLTEWSNGLEKIGANHGENARNTESTRSENNVPESTNRNTEVVRQNGENPIGNSSDGAVGQDSVPSQGQRPELNGMAQQPHQEAQITPTAPPVEAARQTLTLPKAAEPVAPAVAVKPSEPVIAQAAVEPAKPVLSARTQQVVDALQSGLRPDQVMARMKLGVKDMQEIQNEVARAESGAGHDQAGDLVNTLPAKLQRDVQIFRDYDMADSTRSLAEKHGVSQATVTRAVRDISDNLAKHGMDPDAISTVLGKDHETISARAAEEEAKAVTGATRGDVAAEVLENRVKSKAEPEHFGAEQGFAHVDTAGESHSGYKVGDDIGMAWEKLAAKHEQLSSALDAAAAPAEQARLQRQLDAVTSEIVKLTETAKRSNKKAAVAAGGVDDIAPVERGETNYEMQREGWEQDDNSRKAAGDGSDTAKPRTEAEQHANDVALLKLVADTITPQYEAMGLNDNTPGLNRLENFRTEPMPSDVEGKIARGVDADGVSQYEVILASHIVESGDQAVITRVVNHEIGHAVDMSLDGGVYSAQPEMKFVVHPTNGSAIGIGPVAREILNHFKKDSVLADDFAYPLKNGLGYDATTLAKETFAQAWHLYQNEQMRSVMEQRLPKTAQYLSEVLKHAQDTTTAIHSPAETGAVQLRESFGARSERTGDASTAAGREAVRSTGEAYSRAVSEVSSNDGRRANSLEEAGARRAVKQPATDTIAVNGPASNVAVHSADNTDALTSRHLTPAERDQLALRPRTQQEQQANDALLQTVVNDFLLPHLELQGIDSNAPGMVRITEYLTEPMSHREEGKIVLDPQVGGMDTYRIIISSRLMESGNLADIVRVIRHEQGHAIDMALSGGVYSTQPEMGFMRLARSNELRSTGVVSWEILNHFRKDGILAEQFSYPLHDSFNFDPRRTAFEVFAQAWHLYQNENTRIMMEAELPHTVKYLNEVTEHVKKSSTTVHGKARADRQQLVDDFPQRFASEWGNGHASTTGSSGTVSSNQHADARSGKTNAGAAESRTPGVHGQDRGRNPEQLYSRAATSTTAVERKALAEQYIKKLPAAAQAPVRSITENVAHFATRGLQSAAFLHDLADWGAKHGMTAMKEVSRLYSEKGAFKSELDKRLGAVAEQYDRLKKPDQKATGEYLMAAQFDHDNGWGYQPEWRDKVSLNAKAKAEWAALDKPVQGVVDAILRHNYEQRAELQKAFNDHINEMYDAKLQGVGPEEAKLIEAERDKALKQAALTETDGAYSPLKRFGEHVVTVRSEEMRSLMEDKTANRDEIRKLMADPEHYQVMHYDSAGEAANKAVELQDKLGDKYRIEASEKAVAMQHGTQAFEVLQHMAESAANHTKDPEFAHALNNAMTYAIIKSMGEKSSRGSQLNRKLVGGMKPEEMVRAFVSNGYADNGILAAAMHNREISQKMTELHQQVEQSRSPSERKARQNFYNELQQRRINALKGADPAPWVTHAMRFTTVWKLITSPAYYLQYISQPLTMAAPVIQGNHGYSAGMGALMRGLRESVSMMKTIKAKGKIEGADGGRLMDMLNDLKKTGTISIGHTQQFGQYHSRPEGSLSRAWIRATDKVAQLPHEVEMHNRIGTALAAYRLEYSKAVSEGKTSEAAHKQATDYARDTINTAYGDYSSFNAPRIMSGGPIRRLVMQYRQFQAIHGAMLVRLMSNAFKGESADVRKAAKLQLAYMAGHYGVLAGAMGIPGAHLVAGALQSVFGDPDGPEDTETFIKRHVGNGAVGKLVTEGVPGLMGMKLSNRMGAGDIFSPFRGDTALVPGTRKEYKDTALAVMGPFLGAMVPQVIDGVDRIGKGDYYRGLEQLMPKGIADVMKASRFATEGVSNRKGDTTLASDALDTGDIVSQALGAQPLKVADAQATANVTHKFEAHFKDMGNELSFRFNEARKDGSSVDSIVEKWRRMQDAQRKEGFRPTPLSNLYQAPQRQRKREMATMGGVEYTKGNRGFVQSLTGDE
ncbi:PLxRFG domain-containing protein [Undibacterium sp. Ji42W]|uniref:PLxRFG domain-containing protein n=1 Tax=Undibacterium sp. Ji42W TaxID=3413039 RepID=UPI003BF2DB97